MEAARRIFGPEAESIADVVPEPRDAGSTTKQEVAVLSLARRRPVTAEEVSVAAGTDPAETAKLLAALERQGKLHHKVHGDKTFYAATGNSDET
jgi:hypothetical protein